MADALPESTLLAWLKNNGMRIGGMSKACINFPLPTQQFTPSLGFCLVGQVCM